MADSGLVSSIPTPTPIAVPNESAGDTQAKNLFSLFLHHHFVTRQETPGFTRRVYHAYSDNLYCRICLAKIRVTH
ncbi:MAG: hypothetical protein N838_28910 [Thiohalocapsa sp. PB-PSB1]|nr:MAG: hypothetical protein N838_28910 [Thiohalocapsa sp. PB-PSB1]